MESYEVEEIVDERKVRRTGELQYLVKWKGYEEFSWEPAKHLDNCSAKIRKYKAQLKVSTKNVNPDLKQIPKKLVKRKQESVSAKKSGGNTSTEGPIKRKRDGEDNIPARKSTKGVMTRKTRKSRDKYKSEREDNKNSFAVESKSEDNDENDGEDDEESFVVERIIEKKRFKISNRRYIWKYLVKWEDYDQCTWEPVSNMTDCQKKIDEFEAQQKETSVETTNAIIDEQITEHCGDQLEKCTDPKTSRNEDHLDDRPTVDVFADCDDSSCDETNE